MIKIPVLQKNDSWETHRDKLVEETCELVLAMREKDTMHLLEELFDVAEVLVGIADKLEQEGYNLKQGSLRHEKKLIDRGWKFKGHIKVE